MAGSDEKSAFKLAVKAACLQLLAQRMVHIRLAMDEAQASANSQEKSSAGDKYETARAMGQLDRDMNAGQLVQAQEEYRFLEAIAAGTLQEQVLPGSIIELETLTLFAAVGLGNVVINDRTVVAISCRSPLFQQLKLKKQGDEIMFGNKKVKLLAVY